MVGRSAVRRLLEADDIASMVECRLSDGGRTITGAVATVDARTLTDPPHPRYFVAAPCGLLDFR